MLPETHIRCFFFYLTFLLLLLLYPRKRTACMCVCRVCVCGGGGGGGKGEDGGELYCFQVSSVRHLVKLFKESSHILQKCSY